MSDKLLPKKKGIKFPKIMIKIGEPSIAQIVEKIIVDELITNLKEDTQLKQNVTKQEGT